MVAEPQRTTSVSRRSFKRRLMVLVVLAVALPAAATCVVLGWQLSSQARALFSHQLQANLATFSLLVTESEQNLAEGVRRIAADNTVQVTIELGIAGQLAAYLESQRQVLDAAFIAAFDRDGRRLAIAEDGGAASSWELVPGAGTSADCAAAEGAERQIVRCGGIDYLVAAAPVLRAREGLGDAGGTGASRLGFVVVGVPLAAPALLAALAERDLGLALIWMDGSLVHASQALDAPPAIEPAVGEYEVAGSAYLGAAADVQVGGRRVRLGLLTPLAPLREALLSSIATVAGIGVVVVAATMLLVSFFANRLLRPVGRLGEGARRFGEGDLEHRIEVDSGDELEDLAQQFNAMAERLRDSYAGLESKVAERTRELSQSLERQTAIAEILRSISRSQFDLAPVYDSLLRQAVRLCRADGAFILQREGEGYALAAHYGLSLEIEAVLRRGPLPLGRNTMIGRTLLDKKPTHLPDVLNDRDYAWPEVQRIGGFRTLLGVPLLREGEAIGVLALTRGAVEPFSEREIELISTFADQAVIAGENVRLFDELQARTRELAQSRLRRFLAPQVAELLMRQGEQETPLESRRAEVTVVFCDLRGFTAFAESAEPEEVMAMLRQYHASLGELIFRFEGTLERFVGDGLLVVFNDPLPVADHPLRAVRMALAMRERMQEILLGWRRFGHELGFGIGIAQGYATVGPIGFDRRLDYAVIGSIPNLASRLCDVAKAGEILVNQRVAVSIEGVIDTRDAGALTLKGFQKPVPSYEVIGPRGAGGQAIGRQRPEGAG